MPNNAYLRGRRLEWQVQKLFKDAGFACMRTAGSHGLADLVVVKHNPDVPLALSKPITYEDIDQVLDGWLPVYDPTKILDPFLYGKKKLLRNGGNQMIHLTPATVIVMQMKTTKGKAKKKVKK